MGVGEGKGKGVHSALCTLHSALCTLHSALCTLHWIVHVCHLTLSSCDAPQLPPPPPPPLSHPFPSRPPCPPQSMVALQFSGGSLFAIALKNAFECFMNRDVEGSKFSNPELLSTYCDRCVWGVWGVWGVGCVGCWVCGV